MEQTPGSAGALRWGLLGSGKMARKFARDLVSRGLTVQAVASRDSGRAASFAADMGLAQSHGSYQELLDSDRIDAIYVALPNHLHAEWSIRAARAGKHVLCEKPAALDGTELEAVLRSAERARVFYMEGFMYRFHPQWGLAAALIEDGRIGEVREVEASFCYDMGFDPANIRQSREAAGGALMDVGCYCLSFCRMIAGAEPVRLSAVSRIDPETGVDAWTSATLEFRSGIRARFECAIREARPHAAIIHGNRGRIEIVSPWHPPGEGAEIRLIPEGGEEERYRTGDGLSLFAREAMEVSEHLRNRQSPAMSWEDSLGQARALATLRKAAVTG